MRRIYPVSLLEVRRRDAGIANATLARELGCSTAKISRLEAAGQRANPREVSEYLAALDRVVQRRPNAGTR